MTVIAQIWLLMQLIMPYQTHLYQTPLRSAEIEAIIRANAHIGEWDGLFIKTKPYYGTYEHGSFALRGTSTYKKSSLQPQIIGYITEKNGSTHIEIAIQPHLTVLIAAILLLSLFALFLLLQIPEMFRSRNFMPIMPFVILLLITLIGFGVPYHNASQKTWHFWKDKLVLSDVQQK